MLYLSWIWACPLACMLWTHREPPHKQSGPPCLSPSLPILLFHWVTTPPSHPFPLSFPPLSFIFCYPLNPKWHKYTNSCLCNSHINAVIWPWHSSNHLSSFYKCNYNTHAHTHTHILCYRHSFVTPPQGVNVSLSNLPPSLIIDTLILSILANGCWSQTFAKNARSCHRTLMRQEQMHI